MPTQFNCTVNQAGPAANNAGETPSPVIYLNLTDVNGSFSNTWFFAANICKKEMLAVALAAISTQSQVNAWLDPPVNPQPGQPQASTQCYNLYVYGT
jgi:hypothetical protein